MAVVGLDFGCLNAVMAQAERGGVTVLLNENSKRLNANLVPLARARAPGARRRALLAGEAASSIARSNYKNTISCMKRFMGRKMSEPEVAAEIARVPGVKFVEVDGLVGVEVMYDGEPKALSIPQCAAMMLFKMSQICADSNKGASIAEVVVSVPAWFTNSQRLAMLDACDVAGLRCLRLMHDTTATALEYGIWRSAKKAFDEKVTQRVLFVDMGYSSYQVSIVDYVIGKLVVKATAWDRTLGGRDFDEVIAAWIAGEFKAKHKCDPMENPKARMKLLDTAEKAKKTLSPHGVGEANIYCECLMNDLDFSIKLTLDKFEELIQPLLDRLVAPVDRALEASGTDPKDLAATEICGGGSRVASVKKVLAARLGLDASATNYGLKTTLNADECVSKGCAMQAAMLSPRFKVKEYQIYEATPFGVSLSWDQGAAAAAAPMDTSADGGDDDGADDGATAGTSDVVLFPRNGETPSTKRLTFRRGDDFKITASYDAKDAALLPAQCEALIGEFTVKGVPPASADAPSRVRVNVAHSVHGTVAISSAQLVVEVPDDEPAKKDDEKKDDAKADGEAKSEEKKDDAPAESKDGEAKAESPAKADAAPAGDAKADAAPTKKKRKYKKTPLEVAATLPKMSKAQLDAALELEAQMANQDRVIQETNDMRNELEAYIYKMRDDVIGDLRPFAADDAKAAFEAALGGAEEWLYEGDGYDATKSQYAARLKDLHALGSPIQARFKAHEDRPAAVSALQTKIEDLKTFANSSDECFAHVDDSERATVRDAATKAGDWLMDMLDKQGKLEQHDDPALLPADVSAKLGDLERNTKAILAKPKPIPKKEEAKAEEPPPAPDATPKDDGDAKMDDASAPDVDMPDAQADKSDVDMPDAAAPDAPEPTD
ncbi:heat shock protein family A (Hsp70) [Aureococcus anophagefferens]|uniref:Heat shock protein family A (Hsp70) n=1 Tax=Aureococcus anophagefferens TaxID=44056 RepID=A0ABR1GEZ4_AURAN